MAELYDPAVSALFLYSLEGAGSADASAVLSPWAGRPLLSLRRAEAGSEGQRYVGQAADGATCQVDWTLAHDTHLLRVTLSLPGRQPPAAWAGLRRTLDELVGQVRQSSALALPWALTCLAHGIVPAGSRPRPVASA
ncbi:MAG: hypothetical protein QME94_19455, partial [Anaerolineae bacterium]|nr:hypothetical protein [Anaerolineae bacterium]